MNKTEKQIFHTAMRIIRKQNRLIRKLAKQTPLGDLVQFNKDVKDIDAELAAIRKLGKRVGNEL